MLKSTTITTVPPELGRASLHPQHTKENAMKSDIRSILLFVLFACHAIAIAMTATGERAVCAVARSLYKASDALRAACTLVVGTFHALHKAAFLSAGHPALALASVALVAAKHFALRILRRPHAGVHSRYVWNNRPV